MMISGLILTPKVKVIGILFGLVDQSIKICVTDMFKYENHVLRLMHKVILRLSISGSNSSEFIFTLTPTVSNVLINPPRNRIYNWHTHFSTA